MNPMDVLALLIARTGSERLPGKVMLPILGKPMLSRQIERIGRASGFDRLLVATSTEPADDPIEGLCTELGLECFRGSLSDVADRCYRAALRYQPWHVLKLSGDCPLADPDALDSLIEFHERGKFDYSSNAIRPTFADGLDAEIFTFDCLTEIAAGARLPSEREHLVPYILRYGEKFRVGSLTQAIDRSHLRWTVDERCDFELVNRVYEALYPGNPAFTTGDIERFLADNPDVVKLNADLERNAGVRRSVEADASSAARSETVA